jgi:hypothetical protein
MFIGNSIAVIGFLIGWFGGFDDVWYVISPWSNHPDEVS